MKNALACLPEIGEQINKVDHILLLSDYDGTLVPFAIYPHPEFLSEELKETLMALSQKPKWTVGLLSGRPLAELKAKIPLAQPLYAGSMGLEMQTPENTFIHPIVAEIQNEKTYIAHTLKRELKSFSDVFVTNKSVLIIVWYHTQDPHEINAIDTIVTKILADPAAGNTFIKGIGKHAFILKPAVAVDKGSTLTTFISLYAQRYPHKSLLTFYLGDDRSDETAFTTVNHHQGISIRVGYTAESNALYYVDTPEDTYHFLKALNQETH